MPVVLPSIYKKSFHWSACLYASRLFLGTISLHLDLLVSAKTFGPQIGGTTASLEICVILIQPEKAPLPIFVTLFGMVTEVSALQLLYLQPIITQYFIDNKSEIWLLFLIAHSKR